MDKKFLLAAMIAIAVFAPAAHAQKFLPGGVQYNAKVGGHEQTPMTSGLRITRTARPLSTGVSAADFAVSAKPQPVTQAAPFTLATAKSAAPYIWYQSALGGYWDASGTTRDVVRADKLYRYGGKFADGTLVPPEPIRDFNAAGHAFRQNETPTQAFWTH